MKNRDKINTNILLINPASGRQILHSQYPLGLSYIAQNLIDEGYQNIQVRDFNVHPFEEKEFINFINRGRFHIVGFTGLVTAYSEINVFSQRIKEISPITKVVLGGGLGTAFPEIILKTTGIDIVAVGEGELTIKDLANCISMGGELGNVKGIYFLGPNQNICKTQPREFIKDLDSIPFPNREIFPTEDYLRVSPIRTFQKKSRIAKMYTSRGCPYQCDYCFLGIWGNHFRHRSPENIVAEMKLLRDRHGVTGIQFVDDVFTFNRNHTLNLCEEMLNNGIKMDWLCSTRVNLVDSELLRVMKRAGCKTICYGIESANQKVLDKMNKKVKVEQAAIAIEKTWHAGIIPYCFFMIGYFGETEESLRNTVDFCIKYLLAISFSFPTPFPGTDLFIKAKNMGLIHKSEEWIVENWKEWQKDLNINLTDIPDKRLKELKFKTEREISRNIFIPTMLRYLKILGPISFMNYCYLRLVEMINSERSILR